MKTIKERSLFHQNNHNIMVSDTVEELLIIVDNENSSNEYCITVLQSVIRTRFYLREKKDVILSSALYLIVYDCDDGCDKDGTNWHYSNIVDHCGECAHFRTCAIRIQSFVRRWEILSMLIVGNGNKFHCSCSTDGNDPMGDTSYASLEVNNLKRTIRELMEQNNILTKKLETKNQILDKMKNRWRYERDILLNLLRERTERINHIFDYLINFNVLKQLDQDDISMNSELFMLLEEEEYIHLNELYIIHSEENADTYDWNDPFLETVNPLFGNNLLDYEEVEQRENHRTLGKFLNNSLLELSPAHSKLRKFSLKMSNALSNITPSAARWSSSASPVDPLTPLDYEVLGYGGFMDDTSTETPRTLTFKESHSLMNSFNKLFKSPSNDSFSSEVISSRHTVISEYTLSPRGTASSSQQSNAIANMFNSISEQDGSPVLIQSAQVQSAGSTAYYDFQRLRSRSKSSGAQYKRSNEDVLNYASKRIAKMMSPIERLPKDIMFVVCQFLSFHDLLQVSMVNCYLYSICSHDVFWKEICIWKGLKLDDISCDYRYFYIYHQIRVILVGDAEIGKTTIVESLTNNPLYMLESYASHQVNECPYHHHTCNNNKSYFIYFWDNNIAKNEFTENRIKSVDVILVCFATDDQQSFKVAKKWLNHLKGLKNVRLDRRCIILIGLKTDARESDIAQYAQPFIVTSASGEKLAKSNQILSYKEACAFNRQGLAELVAEIIRAKEYSHLHTWKSMIKPTSPAVTPRTTRSNPVSPRNTGDESK
jgi:hypothetical protein